MKLSRYKRQNPTSYTFGATLSYELLQTHPELIQRVFLRPTDKQGEDFQKIISSFKQHNIEIIESAKPFNILGAKDNCLLIAEFTKQESSLESNANHIVLVNPSDSGNLGTIMRTATGFSYHNIAIITPAVDQFDPKSVRASMGALFHLNVETFSSIESYLEKYPNRSLYAFMLSEDAKDMRDIDSPEDTYSLVFGNEAAGLPANFADFCQATIIPQSKNIDSLNLSIAAGVAMYYFGSKTL